MYSTDDLATLIARHTPVEGVNVGAVRNLSLIRCDTPSEPSPAVYEASLCLIARGSKQVSLGDRRLVYDASRYLIVSMDLPLVGHVLETPYLCCKVDLDPAMLADLVLAAPEAGVGPTLPILAAYTADDDLLDAVCRLVRLLDRPAEIAALSPLYQREILFRLLAGPHAALLRQIATADTRLHRIGRVIARIRATFDRPLTIEALAAEAGMSASSLHSHFRAVTRMSPIEYQKQLRLHEARRLMLGGGVGAAEAGFAVGYDSPSQFSREYRRLFGAPPRRDIARLHTPRPLAQAA